MINDDDYDLGDEIPDDFEEELDFEGDVSNFFEYLNSEDEVPELDDDYEDLHDIGLDLDFDS